MRIVKEYHTLIENIAAIKSEISRKEREYNRLIDSYKPAGFKSVDYSRNRSSSFVKANIVDVAITIAELKQDIICLKNELKELIKQRKELEQIVSNLKDTEKQIIMLRLKDPKITMTKLARMTYVSERTVNNILKKIRENKSLRDFA